MIFWVIIAIIYLVFSDFVALEFARYEHKHGKPVDLFTYFMGFLFAPVISTWWLLDRLIEARLRRII